MSIVFQTINNLFFLGGVDEHERLQFQRAKDKDIVKKNYFYLDFDLN
jgi:hypothetical protein